VSGPIAWFARNHVAANLLLVGLVAGGLVSLPLIQQKSFPDINIEVIQIGVPYPGAAPEEVEEGVCVRIEEELQGISGIERITSTATEGACGVTAELITGYPVDRALAEIKNAVDAITTFPEEAEEPVVSHFTIRRTALQIALWGDASEGTLKVLGERIRDEIAALPGVTQVELAGDRPYEISIEVPEASLRKWGLRFDEVVEAVRRSSLDLPGGMVRTRAGEILLRTKGQAYTGADFERIPVRTGPDGSRLLLGDVARVVDGFAEEDRYARFNGHPAVMVVVYRVGDQKVLDLVAAVKDYVARAEAWLPEGLHLTVWRDGSQALRDRLDILLRNGRGGFVLVFTALALFLRLRLAFWVALGVPVSFLGALALFPLLDLSIDVISLFAFILVLGLLVDDAIVVGENVHTHQERDEDPLEAAIRGTREVAVPVIFGVLTTVAAFLPLIVTPGPMGQIFGAIGVVVICCLFFSLVESQLVLPAHLGHVRIRDDRPDPSARGLRAAWQRRFKALQGRTSEALQRLAREVYGPAVERAVAWRYTTLAGAVFLLVAAAGLLASGRIRFSFFPPVESDYVSATLTMPQGTPVEITAAAVAELEAAAFRVKRRLDERYGTEHGSVVREVLATVGEQPGTGRERPPGVSGAGGGSHLGEVAMELLGGDLRPLSAREVAELWREETPPIADVEELSFESALFSLGSPIDIELRSPDMESLVAAAERLKEKLAEYPGVSDLADSFREGKDEIVLGILPEGEILGLTQADLARQVRQAFYGEEAQRIQRGRHDVKVMVRYPQAERRSLANLAELRLRTPAGAEIPFYAAARATPGRGYANIQRADRQRVVRVTADVDEKVLTAGEVLADLEAEFLPALLADHPGLGYSLEGEQREQRKTLGSLVRNYTLALLLIYALLAVPLRSYAQPLIIMSVIPFGLVGAMAGHLLMGLHFSMMSVFGIVALSGVVVNSSLVLVHYVNARVAEGASGAEAVRQAGIARFRPILLTSLTTFAGLTPLLLERSLSAQFLIPMATSLGFGVLFATVIALFLVPSAYLVLDDLEGLRRRAWRRARGQPPEAAPARAAGAATEGLVLRRSRLEDPRRS